MGKREFNVIVFGATGFTGTLCAEHLAREYGASGEKLSWAIAGRSKKKLQAVKDKHLKKYVGEWCSDDEEAIPLVVADSGDYDSLVEMCKRTAVVVSTVGPFMKYGTPLVKACIEAGTDYCDSTGETNWIRRLIKDFESDAQEKGVRIVPSCGYDSIPSDLGVLALKNSLPDGAILGKVTNFVGPTKGGVSGGTLHTMASIMGGEDKKWLMDTYTDPYSLVPKKNKGSDSGDQKFVHFSKLSGKYTSPFFMAAGNERLVRRSAYLNGYGEKFGYLEVMAWNNPVVAFFVAIGMGLAAFLMILPPTRYLLTTYVLPSAGSGPDRKTMIEGFGTMYLHAKVDGTHHLMQVFLDGDVGYLTTGKMLGESAVQLSKTRGMGKGGLFTAASCPGLGRDLIDALEASAGVYFSHSEYSSSKEVRDVVKAFNDKAPRIKNH